MKLLHVVPSFGLGGMEKVLCAVINALPSQCHQGILSLTGETEATKWIYRDTVQCVPFERPQGNAKYLRALYDSLQEWAPDVLMTYNWGATDAIWLGRLCGIQHIIHSEHGFNVDEATSTQWKRNLIRLLVYRCASKLIVVSRDLETVMHSQFQLSAERIRFIANGIDTDFYSPNVSERQKMRDGLGLRPDEIAVGYAGRLDPVKNFPLLLDAFELSLRSDRRFKLILIGDGPDRKVIEHACRDYEIQNSVMLVGKQENVLPYLRALDVFALTSFREQMPMSMLEAMAVGVPVLASSVGEIPTILQNKVAGFYHDLDEGPQAFSQSLLKFKNSELRQRMSYAARNLVVHQFQQQTMIRNYFELLEDVTCRNWSELT